MNSLILKLILYAGIIAGIIILFNIPTLNRATDEQYELTLAGAKLDALNQESAEIQSIVKNVLSIESEDDNAVQGNQGDGSLTRLPVNRAIASYPDIHDIILSFEDIGRLSGLVHVDVNPAIEGVVAGEDGVSLIDVTVRAKGDYDTLIIFLRNLENAGRVFTIHSLVLRNDGGGDDDNNATGEEGDSRATTDTSQDPVLEISLSGVVYYFQK